MNVVLKKYGNDDRIAACPYCGGTPELVQVSGEDYILRCSKCHASTSVARMGHLEAIDDWNAGSVVDDHFSITMDTRIDDYLAKGIKDVLLSKYSTWEKFSQTESGFLFYEAVIVTPEIILVLENAGPYIEYDDRSSFNPKSYNISLAKENEQIRFVKSEWVDDRLSSIEFLCGNRRVVITAEADKQYMIALTTERREQ